MHFTVVTGLIAGPTLLRIFSLSKTQLGLVYGAASTGMLVMALLAGKIVLSAGPGKSLSASVCLVLAGIMALLFSNGFYLLASAFFILGVANALLINSNTSILSELFPEKIRGTIALYSALYFGISAMLSPAVGYWLNVARTGGLVFWSFRLPYIFIALFFAIFLFFIRKTVIPGMASHRKSGDHHDSPPNKNRCPSMAIKSCWRIPLMAFLHSLLVSSIITWINPMAQESFGSNELQGAIFVGVITAGIALGRLSIAAFKLVWDDRTLLAFGTFTGGFFILLGLLSPGYAPSLIFVGMGSYLSSVSMPCIISIAGRLYPENRPRIYGYIYTSMGISGILAPPAIGRLADFSIPLWIIMIVAPVSAFIMGGISYAWKQGESGPEKREQEESFRKESPRGSICTKRPQNQK